MHALLLALLLTLPCQGRAASVGLIRSAGPLAAAPVSFVTCPDAPEFAAIVNSLPARLWPSGARWTVTECDEAAWPAACRPYGYPLPPRGQGVDGFVVCDPYSPAGIHAVYVRAHAPDGVPAARILWHELGHVIWPGLVDTDAREFMAVSEVLKFFGGGQYEFPRGRPSRTEEAFALAFEANRYDRAHAGDDWGQRYIDALFDGPVPSPASDPPARE